MNHEHTWSCVGTPSRSLPTTDRLGGFARARRATVMMSSAVTASILAQTSCTHSSSSGGEIMYVCMYIYLEGMKEKEKVCEREGEAESRRTCGN